MDALHQGMALPVTQLGVRTTRRRRIHVDEIVDTTVRQMDTGHHGTSLHVRGRSSPHLGEDSVRLRRETGLIGSLVGHGGSDTPIPIHLEDVATSHLAFTPRALP